MRLVAGEEVVVVEVVEEARSGVNDMKRGVEEHLLGAVEHRKTGCLKTRTPLVEVEVADLT
jgi:hypothetical protein